MLSKEPSRPHKEKWIKGNCILVTMKKKIPFLLLFMVVFISSHSGQNNINKEENSVLLKAKNISYLEIGWGIYYQASIEKLVGENIKHFNDTIFFGITAKKDLQYLKVGDIYLISLHNSKEINTNPYLPFNGTVSKLNEIWLITQIENMVGANKTRPDWLDTFDLDGDSINDRIYFDFTGGAHCCYKINIVLSSDKMERKFPFEMDGGYVGGVDNSNPNQFDIRDIDNDGLPEILMQIQTYNGQSYTIPTKWKIKYGIKSNRIVIEYTKGKIKTRDYKP